MTNTQTQPTNERPSDPNDTLNTLWEMSEQGKAEWWCRLVKRGHFNQCGKWTWHYEHPWNKEIVRLDDQHALDLVEKSCERWLVGKGWEIFQSEEGYSYEVYPDPDDVSDTPRIAQFDTLHKAIECAMQSPAAP